MGCYCGCVVNCFWGCVGDVFGMTRVEDGFDNGLGVC